MDLLLTCYSHALRFSYEIRWTFTCGGVQILTYKSVIKVLTFSFFSTNYKNNEFRSVPRSMKKRDFNKYLIGVTLSVHPSPQTFYYF